MTNLASYLHRKNNILEQRRADYTAHPESATVHLTARSFVAGLTGARPTYMGQHYILTDSAAGLAGHALGPTAPEMLLGALASCLVHTYLIQATLLEIHLEHVEIEVSGALNMAGVVGLPNHEPPRLEHISYVPKVDSTASPEQLAQLHAAVDVNCPVLNTLRFAVEVRQNPPT